MIGKVLKVNADGTDCVVDCEIELPVGSDLSYERKVEEYIREKYSVSDELAILRQRNTKKAEFKEYYDYVESCKEKAKR